MAAMIRNACIHLNGEQPMLCDLFDMPSTSDVALRCTNLRTMNGKRPIFADDSDSTFYFPMIHIRFLEIPPTEPRRTEPAPVPVGVAALLGDGADGGEHDGEPDLEIDEDFLRRVREA